ncbi:glycosyltransferase [Stutzerimonas stutzeri]|uniref:glycosyltransferase n=1 Tax=Stutzerimonas stutzeri TaxID=316 RepID=UPI001C4B7553|nr:glycosyltransferase [Stutzerimonas stutzeri]QXP27306.1 glycosyltransferase [Stutzerimonas stutzeri]
MKDKFGLKVWTWAQSLSETGGGVSAVALQVHDQLIRSGEEAYLITGFENMPAHDPELKESLPFDRVTEKSSKMGVVHIHGLWSPFVLRAYKFAKKNGYKLVVSPHGMLEPWALKNKFIKKRIAWHAYQRRIINSADMLMVNSSREMNSVRSLGIKNPISIVANGVNKAGFVFSPPVKGSKVVLFFSRLSPVKGLPDLLEAWEMLPPDHDYLLKIYGHSDPGYEETINRIIKSRGLQKSVKICGPVFSSDKWKVYREAAVFVLPSYSENFGIVVAEALLSGLPVITTKATPWDCLVDEGFGWQVDNSPAQLSQAIVAAMNLTEAERERVCSQAYFYANSRFDWSSIADDYMACYRWLLGLSDKPDYLFNGES